MPKLGNAITNRWPAFSDVEPSVDGYRKAFFICYNNAGDWQMYRALSIPGESHFTFEVNGRPLGIRHGKFTITQKTGTFYQVIFTEGEPKDEP